MQKHEIPLGQFKQHCLSILEEVAETGVELVITNRGVPLCRLAPLKPSRTSKRIGWMKGTISFHDDITKPTNEKWNVLND